MPQKKDYNPDSPISDNRGVALILAILTIGVLITIVLTLSAIFIPKIRLSKDTRNSVGAIYAAESAIEWCIYNKRNGVTLLPVMANGATYTDISGGALDASDCSGSSAKIIGNYQGVTRAFDVTF